MCKRIAPQELDELFKKFPEYIEMKKNEELIILFEQSLYKQFEEFDFYDGEIGWDTNWCQWTIDWSSFDVFVFNKRVFKVAISAHCNIVSNADV